jgi:hypothetical protein
VRQQGGPFRSGTDSSHCCRIQVVLLRILITFRIMMRSSTDWQGRTPSILSASASSIQHHHTEPESSWRRRLYPPLRPAEVPSGAGNLRNPIGGQRSGCHAGSQVAAHARSSQPLFASTHHGA